MSLDSWERRSLVVIEESLSASAPELGSLLATFNRLTAGEDMPPHAKMRWRPPQRRPRKSRRPRRGRQPRGGLPRRCRRRRSRGPLRVPQYLQERQFHVVERWWKAYLAIWVIFFVGMVAAAVALSNAGPPV